VKYDKAAELFFHYKKTLNSPSIKYIPGFSKFSNNLIVYQLRIPKNPSAIDINKKQN